MTPGKARDDVTDAAAAARKFASLAEECSRWKGPPIRSEEREERRLVAWDGLEIRQAGRGVMVRAQAPWFDNWWHDKATWDDDPMGAIREWIEEERRLDESQGRDSG